MTYGAKKSSHFRHTRIMARVASVRARRLEEERGLLLDAKKQFRMELKRNQGIGWYRSLQICKHLEMHERGKGPVITETMRDKITKIASMVKLGRTLWKIKVDIHQVYNLRLLESSSELPDPYIAASLEFPSLGDGKTPDRPIQRTASKSKMSSGNFNSVMLFIVNVNDLEFNKVKIMIKVHNAKKYVEILESDGVVIGTTAFSLSAIYSQNNHWLPREWLPITHPMAPGDCRGYIQVSIGVFGPGDDIPIQLSEFQLNASDGTGKDSVSRSILEKIVQTPETNFHSCMLVFNILRAENLPVLAGGDRRPNGMAEVAPTSGYVKVSFLGMHAFSRVIFSNSNPSWNESIRIPVLCPSWDQQVVVEVFSRTSRRGGVTGLGQLLGGGSSGQSSSGGLVPASGSGSSYSDGDLLLGSFVIDFDTLYRTGIPPTWLNMYNSPGAKNFAFGSAFGCEYVGRLQVSGSVARSSELVASIVPYDTSTAGLVSEPVTEEIVLYVDLHELAFLDDAISEQNLPNELWVQIQFGPNSFESPHIAKAGLTCLFNGQVGRVPPIRIHIPRNRSMAYDMVISVFGTSIGQADRTRLCFSRLPVDRFLVNVLSNGTLPVSDPEWIRLSAVRVGADEGGTARKTNNNFLDNFASVFGIEGDTSKSGEKSVANDSSSDTLFQFANVLMHIAAFRVVGNNVLNGALPVRQERVPYETKTYELRLCVHQACNLPIAHPVYLSSAYVRVTLAGVTSKTSVVPVTLYPVWNDLIRIEVDLPENPALRPDVVLEVMDNTSELGTVILRSGQLKNAWTGPPVWYKLTAGGSSSNGATNFGSVQQDSYLLCSATLMSLMEAHSTPLPLALPQRATFTADLLIVGIRLLKNYSIENYNQVEVSWGRHRDNLRKKVVKIQTGKPISGEGGQFNYLQPALLDLDLAMDSTFQEFLEIRLIETGRSGADGEREVTEKNEISNAQLTRTTGYGYIHLNPHYTWLSDPERVQYRESFRMKTHEEIRKDLEAAALLVAQKKSNRDNGMNQKRSTRLRREQLALMRSANHEEIEMAYIENEIDGMFGIDAKENYVALPMQYFNSIETESLFPARFRSKQQQQANGTGGRKSKRMSVIPGLAVIAGSNEPNKTTNGAAADSKKKTFLEDFVWESTISKEKQHEVSRPQIDTDLESSPGFFDKHDMPYVTVPLVLGSADGSESFVVVGYLKVFVQVREKSTLSEDLLDVQKQLSKQFELAERLMCRLYCLRIEGVVPGNTDDAAATDSLSGVVQSTAGGLMAPVQRGYYLWIRNISNELIAEFPNCSIKDDGSAEFTNGSNVNPEFNKCYQLSCSFPENSLLSVELYERTINSVTGSSSDMLIGSSLIDLENRWFSPKFQQFLKHPSEIPIENCILRAADKSGIPRGKMKMWIELMDQVTSMGRPIETLPSPQPETIQVRIALWRTKGVPNAEGEDQCHQGVTMMMHGVDEQKTDTHYGSLDGTGTFNWRFVFNPVVPTEDASLRIQLQHRPLVGLSNVAIGEVTLDLSHELAIVRRTRRAIDLAKAWVPLSHPAHAGKFRGSIEIKIRILTSEEARSFPVGLARESPNVDPFLDGDDPHLLQHRSVLANTALGRSFAKFIEAMRSGLRLATILFIVGSVIAGIVALIVFLMYIGVIKFNGSR